MARLLNKLNVLVRSSVTQTLKRSEARHRDRTETPISGKRLAKEIDLLRKEIERALSHEDSTTADIRALESQIAQWDQQADEALKRGDEAAARHLVQQIQRAQRQHAMLEADLDQHRRAVSELIRQVNELDALAALARQGTPPQADADIAGSGPDTESLAERLRQARQHAAGQQARTVPAAEAQPDVDEQLVEDDLARRRNRLSL